MDILPEIAKRKSPLVFDETKDVEKAKQDGNSSNSKS